jgi:hypothetical protein
MARRALRRVKDSNGERSTVVLLVGDHDADGIAAIDSTADDAWTFFADFVRGAKDVDPEKAARALLRFDIVAVTRDQIDRYHLESVPSSHHRGDFDGPEVQVEAFDAVDFAAVLEAAIRTRITDLDRFDARASLRDEHRDELRRRLGDGPA